MINWYLRPQPKIDEIDKLKNQLPGISDLSAAIFIQRELDDLSKIKKFVNPSFDQLHDPFLMKDMDNAVNTLSEHIGKSSKILLYGDYDVDGSCSVALSYLFLKNFCPSLEFYIPDRYSEGYGVSRKAIDYIQSNGIQLVITMDCGIRNKDYLEELQQHGIDVIICDHHEPSENLPLVSAVLDPKRKDCIYPFKELCGCGVTFKLMQAFSIQQGIESEILNKHLDLVALATCADIVHMNGENRVIVHLGLEELNKGKNIGLDVLREKSGLKYPLNVRDLVFGFAPRINAAGRIDHAKGSVELLIASDRKYAEIKADAVNFYNAERKDLDRNITQEALQQILNSPDLNNKCSTVLVDDNWSKGVVGIVASRCIEKYYRPTIIFGKYDGILTGSARSVGDFDILTAIEDCGDLLLKYGGHKFAAGLSMKAENFLEFQERFEKIVSQKIKSEDKNPKLWIDCSLPLSEISFQFYDNILKRLEPFGPKHMQPVFMTLGISNYQNPQLLKEEHLKFEVKTEKEGKEISFDCLAFGRKDAFEWLLNGETIDLAYSLEVNEYGNTKKLQLMVKDIKKSRENKIFNSDLNE